MNHYLKPNRFLEIACGAPIYDSVDKGGYNTILIKKVTCLTCRRWIVANYKKEKKNAS